MENNSQIGKIAPGPSEAINFWEDPLNSFASLTQQYGDVVCLDPNTHSIYLINNPTAIKYILQDNYHNYKKDSETFKPILGNGLLISEGDLWLKQRRIVQPAFHHRSLQTMINPIINTTTEKMKFWEAFAEHGESLDLLKEMTELTINVSATTMFGTDIKNNTQLLAQAIAIAQEYIFYQGWDYEEKIGKEPSDETIQFENAIKTIDNIVYAVINERRQNKQGKDDLLAMLLHATDETTGDPMSEKQLRDEVVTMLTAGQGTTAVALTWMLYILSTHPDVEHRVHAEIDQTLGQDHFTFEDLSKLTYTRMVIDEVLRLYPSSWLTTRRSIKEDEIAGYHIPQNSEIFFSAYLTHRHPDFWKDPELFNPERFSPEQSLGRPHFAYLPFGGGPHICIGNHFASLIIQSVIAIISKTYHLQLISEQKIKPQPQILLQPEKSIFMKIQKRSY